jgi:membrane associated rhomboid family serine protease
MIPLKDRNPTSTPPVINVMLIIMNVLVFLYQFSLGPALGERFIMANALIPARLEHLLTTPGIPLPAALAPLVTHMFLHGGFLHILGNMWFLWIFGDNIEDRLGHFSYLVFYLVCGIAAAVLQTMVSLGSRVPMLGASGAISGVLGAYLVLYPRARVLTLVPLLFFFFTVDLPAVLILGYWFLIQFLSGLESLGMRAATQGGTAWWAHIGGFVTGIVLVRLWPQRQRMVRYTGY